MARGLKTGGRKKGTPNRRSMELGGRLANFGFDPTALLIDELKKPAGTAPECFDKDRAKILMGLHEYLYAKRKPLEEAQDDGSIDVTPDDEVEGYTDEELEELASLPPAKAKP